MAASVRILLVAFFLQACAHKEAAPSPASEAAAEVQQPSNEAAAGEARPPRGESVAPVPPVVEAVELPACADAAAFTSLADAVALSETVEKPSTGRISLRGKLWSPAVVRCTAGLPARCMGEMLLSDTQPQERTSQQILLTGQLPDARPLICSGVRGDVRCPIPTGGAEYGVTGTLLVEGEGEERWLSITAESLCRF